MIKEDNIYKKNSFPGNMEWKMVIRYSRQFEKRIIIRQHEATLLHNTPD